MEITKLEVTDTDQVIKMIKREEVHPMIQRQALIRASYNALAFQLNLRTAPWVWGNYQYPYLVSTFNTQPLYNYCFLKTQQVEPLKYTFEETFQKSLSNEVSTPSVEAETSSSIEVKLTDTKLIKKSARVSACKNYIGLICAGFARSILTAQSGSEILKQKEKILNQVKCKFESFKTWNDKELVDCLKHEIYKTMCGKKVKKSNRERDFKVRNTEELDNLLIIKPQDNEFTRLRKEVVKEMLDYFFNSDEYNQWLSNGMMSESNRVFFINNKEEIYKKFMNPGFYKPHFNHTSK